jgi:HAE1 family hydrophobic/amphiphilic exporter-1
VTALFDHGTDALVDVYQGILRWSLQHKLTTLAMVPWPFLSAACFMVPLLGTEFVPKSDFSETNLTFHTPVGSSLDVTEAKAQQVDAHDSALPEVRYTLTTINTGNAAGKIYASVYIRLVDRKPSAAAASMTCRCCCANGCARCPASASPMWGCSTRWAAKNRLRSRSRAPT